MTLRTRLSFRNMFFSIFHQSGSLKNPFLLKLIAFYNISPIGRYRKPIPPKPVVFSVLLQLGTLKVRVLLNACSPPAESQSALPLPAPLPPRLSPAQYLLNTCQLFPCLFKSAQHLNNICTTYAQYLRNLSISTPARSTLPAPPLLNPC